MACSYKHRTIVRDNVWSISWPTSFYIKTFTKLVNHCLLRRFTFLFINLFFLWAYKVSEAKAWIKTLLFLFFNLNFIYRQIVSFLYWICLCLSATICFRSYYFVYILFSRVDILLLNLRIFYCIFYWNRSSIYFIKVSLYSSDSIFSYT